MHFPVEDDLIPVGGDGGGKKSRQCFKNSLQIFILLFDIIFSESLDKMRFQL